MNPIDKNYFEEKLDVAKKHLKKVQQFLTINKQVIKLGQIASNSIVETVKNKTPVSLVSGALEAISALTIGDMWYARDYFPIGQGWYDLTVDGERNLSELFGTVIRKYPSKSLSILDGDRTRVPELIALPIGVIGCISSESDISVLYQPEKVDRDKLLSFLVKEKVKELNSNFFSLFSKSTGYGSRHFSLVPEKLNPLPSRRAQEYVEYFKRYFDKGIHRSVLFYGPPGTGKSTLVQYLLSEFGFRTFKFRCEGFMVPFGMVRFIIENFDCEAVMMDDMDHMIGNGSNSDLLETLEVANRHSKFVIGCANVLSGFHSALIRPKRFDEIIKIDTLDEETIIGVLGDLSPDYKDKVRHWPIAYVSELKTKSLVVSAKELEAAYVELNERVKNQLVMVGKENEDGDEKKSSPSLAESES